jgi:hypothetical protein
MSKRYFVIFSGLDKQEEYFREGMSRLGVSSDNVERIIHKAPVILKAGMQLAQAKRYATAVQEAGGRVGIREYELTGDKEGDESLFYIEPMENFIMCPQCGHKQLKRADCVKCGFIFKDN